MFVVLATLTWALVLGLLARRFGAGEAFLLLAGIVAAVAIQFFVFGPS